MLTKERSMRLQGTILAALMMASVPLWGQSRPSWETASDIRSGARGSIIGTITDLDSARNVVTFTADGDRSGTRIRASSDSVTTRFYGFGSGTEVLQGTVGFGRLKEGDRVQITGMGRPSQALTAEEVLLIGRSLTGSTSASAQGGRTIEGVVRQVSARDNRLVIETSDRNMYNVSGTDSTPVYYKGEVYRVRNVEVGDRIRVQVESGTGGDVRARIIDVVSSVQDSGGGTGTDGRTLTSVTGRITRIDTRAESLRINSSRGEVRVDARTATDNQGRDFRLTDLQVGDFVELSGRWEGTETFRADTIRFSAADDRYNPRRPTGDEDDADDDDQNRAGLDTVVIYGTVEQGLQQGDLLLIKDTSSSKKYSITLLDDFIVQLKNGSYVTADQLKKGDRIVVKAFRDDDSHYIAQTVRTR